MSIKLNDILQLDDLNNVKIRFNIPNQYDNPIRIYKEEKEKLDGWQYWNYTKNKSFHKGQIAVGFIRISGDQWLLFDISRITKDLNKNNAVGYEWETLTEYEKYFGRLVINFKNKSQNMIRKANSVLDDCTIHTILSDTFDNDIFPGYENVNIPWRDLQRVINKDAWKTALSNQKGVYLITDKSNGKKYVGSATGNEMIHQRWSQYVAGGHGGNQQLKELTFDHIKDNFCYSILEIFKSTVDDEKIITRESWWKETLLTRGAFGYNSN